MTFLLPLLGVVLLLGFLVAFRPEGRALPGLMIGTGLLGIALSGLLLIVTVSERETSAPNDEVQVPIGGEKP